MVNQVSSFDTKDMDKPERGEMKKDQNICPSCFNEFSTNKRMKCHWFFCQPNEPIRSETKSHVCSACNQSYQYIGQLIKHKLSVHNTDKSGDYTKLNYNCTTCIKTFSTKANLKVHDKALHTIDPIEKCDICRKQFSNKIRLSMHIKQHTKGNICDICGSRWHKPSELNAHHFKVHALACDINGKLLFFR